MMSLRKNHFFATHRYFLVLVLLLLSAMVGVAFTFSDYNEFELAKQQILLRKIGHELLLQAGDRTSRVLPVIKIGKSEYQIKFEKEFSFTPDSLVKIVSEVLNTDKLAGDYVVNVLNCTGRETVYGYAVIASEKNDVIPCKGRKMPTACYVINIQFQENGMTALQKGYLLSGLPFLAFVGLMFVRRKTGLKSTIGTNLEGFSNELMVGRTMFSAVNKTLNFGGKITHLTAKEAKLLFILTENLNQIVERAKLQKEIWEDEGVIVGRSLDMFISKLRKKLEEDTSIQLKNIHGKGYKLETIN